MRLCFWGVRGSLPAPKQGNWGYGGNTPCVEVRTGDRLLILDAGSGVQDLGEELSGESGPSVLHLLFSHYHWDHVQGLPFFAPLYCAGKTLEVFGPRPKGGLELEGVLQALFRAPFFPVSADRLSAALHLKELGWRSSFALGEVRVRTCRLHHPQGALAYRLEHDGAVVVYATDHEPGDPICDAALRQLARGADLLISDAQYSPTEMPQKAGWGHGCWEASVALAREAGVKGLVLFHHDPFRNDREIDEFVSQARQSFSNTWAAKEGMFFDVTPERVLMGQAPVVTTERLEADQPAPPALELDWDTAWLSETPPTKGNGARSKTKLAETLARLSPPKRRPLALVTPEGSSPAAEPSPPPVGLPPTQQRRHQRISLEGTNAYGMLENGNGTKVLRALDVSFGGVGLLLDEVPSLPEVFEAQLNVPILPAAAFRLRRIYTQALPQGGWRMGCSFSA